MPVEPVPTGYHTVTPYLVVADVAGLIDFMSRAFGAVETSRFAGPDGRIMHAEVKVGDSPVMLGESGGEWKPMPSVLHMYVSDVDAVYADAIAAGAASLREPKDQFYGDRMAGVEDAAGNQWWIATHVEDVSPEEMRRRANESSSG